MSQRKGGLGDMSAVDALLGGFQAAAPATVAEKPAPKAKKKAARPKAKKAVAKKKVVQPKKTAPSTTKKAAAVKKVVKQKTVVSRQQAQKKSSQAAKVKPRKNTTSRAKATPGKSASTKAPAVKKAVAPLKPATSVKAEPTGDSLQQVKVIDCVPGPYQPRRDMDSEALSELAQSIRSQGVIQPIVVRQVNGQYEIIAGERRWRAAQLAGLKTVPVVLKDIPDESVMAMALIENIQRQDLNVVETSRALQRLIEEIGMTHQAVAQVVGKSRAAVSNLLRLLKSHPAVLTALEKGQLEMGHARALLSLPAAKQPAVAKVVQGRGLSVRQTEMLIQKHLHPESSRAAQKTTRDPNIIVLERKLSETLGAAVKISQANDQKGRLEITYHSHAELEGILARIH